MLEQQKMHGLWTRLQNRENDQNFVNNGNKLQKPSFYYRKTAKKRSRFDVASGMPPDVFLAILNVERWWVMDHLWQPLVAKIATRGCLQTPRLDS